ncbi:hypothetical protein RB213_014178 [Colletotrichum asianum]
MESLRPSFNSTLQIPCEALCCTQLPRPSNKTKRSKTKTKKMIMKTTRTKRTAFSNYALAY